jgi:hypothetical protein
LRILGHGDFTRRIAPHVAAGDLHGLLLGAPNYSTRFAQRVPVITMWLVSTATLRQPRTLRVHPLTRAWSLPDFLTWT